MPVADSIGERVGEGFPDAEPLHGGQGVVQDVGVVAVGGQRQRSVRARPGGKGDKGHGIVEVGIARPWQDAGGGEGSVFDDGSCGRQRCGCVVGPADGDGQGVGGRASMPVADSIGERVGEGFSDAEPLHGGQGVVQDVGIAAAGREGQGAVGPGRAGLGQEDHRVVGVGVRGCRHDACEHGAGVFGHAARGDGSGQGRRIDPVDGDGQRVRGGAAVIVRHRVGEGVGQGFPEPKLLHHGEAVVQGVDIRA